MFTDASSALLLAANNNTEKSILLTLIRGTTTLALPGTTTPNWSKLIMKQFKLLFQK